MISIVHHWPIKGGSSRSIVEIIPEELKSEITIFCPLGSSFDFFKESGYKVIPLPPMPNLTHLHVSIYSGLKWLVFLPNILFFICLPLYLLFYIKELNATKILHFNDVSSFPAILIFKLFTSAKTILHVRSFLETKVGRKRILFRNWVINNYVDQIISIDKKCQSAIQHLNCNKKIIYNTYRKLPLTKAKSNNIRFGYLGGNHRIRGFGELQSAIINVLNNIEDVEFHLFGDYSQRRGFIRDSYYKFTKSLVMIEQDLLIERNKKRVFFHGFKQNHLEIYSKFDVLISPLQLNAVGRPVIEAMSYGIPSICAAEKFYTDTFQDQLTGVRIDPYSSEQIENAIYEILDQREKISVYGRNSKIFFENKFSYEVSSKKLKHIYDELS